MSTYNYLTYLANPVDAGSLSIAVRIENENKIVSPDKLIYLKGDIVTHDSWYLIDTLKDLKCEIPNSIIDINLLERFLAGIPEYEAQTKNGLSWDTYNILLQEYADSKNLKAVRRHFWSNEKSLKEEVINEFLFEFLEALERYYLKKLEFLSIEEKAAIFEIEMPVLNVFLQAQTKGVSVDNELITRNLDAIDTEYYKVLSVLKDKYAFKGGPFDTAYIHSYIEENGIDTDRHYIGSPVDQIIEYTKDYDDRMQALHELRRSRSTKNALLKLSFCDDSKAHIIFNTFGTVTGRITAVEPPVQYIKKEYRGVIIPSPGYECLYVDYSNYEPSILAFLSEDKKLVDAVNGGKFYDFIAEKVLDSKCNREVAKILFIQYSYGASVNTLSRYINNKTGVDLLDSEKLAKGLVDYFDGVNTWKKSVIKKAMVDNKVITSDLIVRNFKTNAIVKDKAKRQIVNHYVQSTGSVHLKKLILQLANTYPEVDVLIPMFDAILLQAPQGDKNYRDLISDIFISSFKESFPGIQSGVTISNFDG
jgi:DNA polymerase I-like protein with 3'-5' exonuclease and polymerase domains